MNVNEGGYYLTTYCGWTRIVRFSFHYAYMRKYVLSRFCTPFDRRHLFGAWAQRKKRYDYYLWVGTVVHIVLVLMLRQLAVPLFIQFFFSRLYIVTTSLRYGFFLPDFMIGLRAKWNSRDQLTDNYHIALIRTYYFCSSQYRCERIHSVFACNRSVWFSLPIILGIWVRRFQNSIHIAENQR